MGSMRTWLLWHARRKSTGAPLSMLRVQYTQLKSNNRLFCPETCSSSFYKHKKIRPTVPRIIKLYYLQRFFHHLNFFWAIDKIFFSSNGINPFQISIMLAVWSAYVLIFEIPSGALADRWSRRWVMTIGSIFHTLSYVVWYFADGFWGFLVGYLVRGTGGFLQSGTREALVYDHLKAINQADKYEKYTGGLWIVTTTAFLLASVFSGVLADTFSFGLVILFTIATNVVSTIFTAMMPDVPKEKSTEEVTYLKFLKTAWNKAMSNPLLLQALFYTMTVLVADGVLDEYDQLYVTALGLPLAGIGVWWVIRMSSEMVAGFVAHRLKVFGRDRVLEIISVITFILLLIASFINSLLMIGVLALCFFFFSVAVILNEGRLQTLIHSHERATINSINAFLKESVAIVVGLSYGFFANLINPRIALLVFASLLLVYILGSYYMNKKSPE